MHHSFIFVGHKVFAHPWKITREVMLHGKKLHRYEKREFLIVSANRFRTPERCHHHVNILPNAYAAVTF